MPSPVQSLQDRVPKPSAPKELLQRHGRSRTWSWLLSRLALCSVAISVALLFRPQSSSPERKPDVFFTNITKPDLPCLRRNGQLTSHAGYIGLKTDTPSTPRKSFFWYFEAELDPDNAPVILTIGGGPGTSALMTAFLGQAPCLATAQGLQFNPHRWTEEFNLLALDHPVGVGYSYGTHVNNSYDAALDVYDFLQKFFQAFPQLQKNQLVLASGSYGGIFLPHIATVIQRENKKIAEGKGQRLAQHINLESLMLYNSLADPMSNAYWILHYSCSLHSIYNEATCKNLFSTLPQCLEAMLMAFERPTVDNRKAAERLCRQNLLLRQWPGTNPEDIREKCEPKDYERDDPLPTSCYPKLGWVNDIFGSSATADLLGIPDHIKFTVMSWETWAEFNGAGDFAQPHHLLFTPLLEDGIRLLNFAGAMDANCAWPGVLSSLKLLRSPFQDDFIAAKDIEWHSAIVPKTTVRSVGRGAGSLTFIVVPEAGHFVMSDQSALIKSVVTHWIHNLAFI